MVRSSLEGLGLDPSAAEVEHEYSRCEGGTSQAEYLGFRFPQIGIDEARPLLLRLRDYWRAVAPKWAQRGFEVKDESIDAPTAPRVFLEIDGFSLAGDRTPRKEEGLEIGGSAPCVPLTE